MKEGDCVGIPKGQCKGRKRKRSWLLFEAQARVGRSGRRWGDAEVGSLDQDNLLYLLVIRSHG